MRPDWPGLFPSLPPPNIPFRSHLAEMIVESFESPHGQKIAYYFSCEAGVEQALFYHDDTPVMWRDIPKEGIRVEIWALYRSPT